MTPFWRRIFWRPVYVFADFIDPFSYIGFHSLRLAAGHHQVPVAWRGFEYNPDTPAEGYDLETGANSDLRPGMWASVERFAAQAGLQFPEPQRICKTQLAQLTLQFIPDQPQKILLISSMYQAYFDRCLDLGRPEVLKTIVRDAGLDPATVDRAFAEKDASRLESCREEAKRLGFLGLPGFLYRGKTYFGALPQSSWDTIFQNQHKETAHV
jgi:predicted DsbA family dithiol-disulfide isomerase